MFKTKKLLTVVLSLAMLLTVASPVLAASGDGAGSGDGDFKYVEIGDRFKVVVPTTTALGFVLDPLGLSAIAPGQSMSVKDLVEGPEAGKVIFNDHTPVVLNESNYPVQLAMSLSISNSGSSGSDDVAMVSTAAAASDGSYANFGKAANNVFIAMRASFDSVNTPTAPADKFVGHMQLPLANTAITPFFVLDEAEYHVFNKGTAGSPDYEYDLLPDTGNGTQLMFVGACNPFADWSGYVAGDTAATAAVVTYEDLAKAIDEMDAADEITVGGATYTKVVDAQSAGEFEDLDELLALLNDQFTGIWVFTEADDDLIATSVQTGPIASHNPVTVVPGNFVIDTTETFTGTLADGAAASQNAPAERDLALSAVFTVAAVANGVTDTPVVGAYGVVTRTGNATGGTWADSSGLGTQRGALETAITNLTGAIATFVAIADPTPTQIETAETALAAANAALTTAKAVANPDASFEARIKVLEDLIKSMGELINADLLAAKADLAKAISDLEDAIGIFEAINDPNAAQIEAAEDALEEAEKALAAAKLVSDTDDDFDAMIEELDDLIKDMKDALAPTTGFIVDGKIVTTLPNATATAGQWFLIPFEFEGKAIESIIMTATGFDLFPTYATKNGAGTAISFMFSTAGNRADILVTLVGDSTEYWIPLIAVS